jgi:Rhs element Vgr protein
MAQARTLPTERSTDLVTFEIFSGGEMIPREHQLLGLTVNREVNKIPYAVLIYKDGSPSDEDFPVSNLAFFEPGREIEIKLGYQNDNQTVYKGIVVKHGITGSAENGSMLKIECKDPAVKMTSVRKHKVYTDLSDSEIFEQIVNGYGFTIQAEDISFQHPQIVQYYATDWDFMLSRAEMNGRVIQCSNGEVTVSKPKIDEPSLELLYGSTIFDFEMEMDARHQTGPVLSKSWNQANQQIDESEGTAENYGQAGNFDEEQLVEALKIDGTTLAHGGSRNETELRNWADAALVKSRLAKIRGRIKCKGFSGIEPGNTLKLAGLGERFNGAVFVAAVIHEMLGGTWYTHIRFGLSPRWFYKQDDIVDKPAAGQLPSVNGLQIGVVTALEGDPGGEERIQVKIPIVDPSHPGIWMRLATLDAGNGRGMVFRPEIGDEVIVGFIENDPRDAVVLGMLHSSAHPSPVEASDDNHKKGFTSREKLELIFDDDEKSVRIETPGGNKILLSDGEGGVFLEDQNGNKIMMSSSGIVIESSDKLELKAAGDIEIDGMDIAASANGSFKASSYSGSELSSSAITEVSGSMVKIN